VTKIVWAGAIAVAIPAVLLLGAFGLASRLVPTHAPAASSSAPARLRVSDGNVVAFARPSDASVHVINARSGKTLAVAHLGDQITSLRFAKRGPYLYATVRDDRHVRQIDTRTGAILVLGER
jgi:hypothetical protein